METADEQNSEGARDYLEEVLTIIEEEALNVPRVDWPAISAAARQKCPRARATRDTHDAIRFVLEELHDGHSFFLSADEVTRAAAEMEGRTEGPTAENRDGIGFVSIEGFNSTDPDTCDRYVRTTRRGINLVDPAVRGWVIDLRENSGGNMWPMLESLYAFLGDGVHGEFVLRERRLKWGLRDGSEFTEETDDPREPTPRIVKPVAVLIGPKAVSAAEAVAVSFRGMSNVRLFGRPTGGLSTANRPIELSDKAVLYLTTGVFADRAGNEYINGIEPDELCEDAERAARAWIDSEVRLSSDA